MMLWCFWRRRNNKVWYGEMKEERIAVQFACEVLLQWWLSRSKEEQQMQHQIHHVRRWQPPDEE